MENEMNTIELQEFSADLVLEMNEMKKLGMRVPAKAIKIAKELDIIKEYTSMKNSECVDLLISLADMKMSIKEIKEDMSN